MLRAIYYRLIGDGEPKLYSGAGTVLQALMSCGILIVYGPEGRGLEVQVPFQPTK